MRATTTCQDRPGQGWLIHHGRADIYQLAVARSTATGWAGETIVFSGDAARQASKQASKQASRQKIKPRFSSSYQDWTTLPDDQDGAGFNFAILYPGACGGWAPMVIELKDTATNITNLSSSSTIIVIVIIVIISGSRSSSSSSSSSSGSSSI